jgi:hypothetical protein
VMTSPHWAEGSVAVVGLPAGGSWLRSAGCWDPSLRRLGSWAVGSYLSAPSFPGFLPRRGASRRTPRPFRATALAVPFAVSVCLSSLQTTKGQLGAAPALGRARDSSGSLLPRTCCHHRARGAPALLPCDPFKLSSDLSDQTRCRHL